jgi:CubicO group peptidase (beta-lactamase class C family)
MLSRLSLPVTALMLVSAIAPASAAEPINPAIVQQVEAARVNQGVPGLALLVMKNGQILHQQGFGLANIELSVPVSPQSLFQTGSIGKMFTAALILKLAESGRISLDDPLSKHLPGTPQSWSAVTVRMMLTHTSGIPNYVLADYGRINSGGEAELARIAFGKPLDFPAGSDWRYSNTAYVLLGQLIQKVTGRFYGDLLVEQVFRPLGMITARPISESEIVPGRVAGYELDEKKRLKNQDHLPQFLNSTADGSLYFSLKDYAAWEAAVRRRDPVLKPTSWAEMLKPGRLNSGASLGYGMGWDVRSAGDVLLRGHGGSWQGFQTYYLAIEHPGRPADDLAVVVLTNLDAGKPGTIARDVAKALAPDTAGLIDCLTIDMRKPCPASPR